MLKTDACPACGNRLIHISWEECAGATGDTWICVKCKIKWVLQFDGTMTQEKLMEGKGLDDIL